MGAAISTSLDQFLLDFEKVFVITAVYLFCIVQNSKHKYKSRPT